MSNLETKLEWALFKQEYEPIFISSSVYGIHWNDIILFKNIKTNEEKYYNACGGDAGDGVSRLAGNKTYSVFAFAEHKFNPNIYINSYPDFKNLCTFKDVNVGEYVDIRFDDAEFLVTLTGFPDYKIIIWNFLMGIKLCEEYTNLCSREQVTKFNMSPFLCAQYAPNLGILNIWELQFIIDNIFLIKRNQKIPFLTKYSQISFVFGIDGNLYIVDNIGNFYSFQPTVGTIVKLWTWNGCIGDYKTHISSYRGGFVLLGSDGLIKHIKKINNKWTVVWDLKTEYSIVWHKGVQNFSVLYLLCKDLTLLQLEETSDNRTLQKIGNISVSVKLIGLLRPHNEHIVIVTRFHDINLLEITKKKLISNIQMVNVIILKTHPKLPIAYIVTTDKKIYLISYYIPENPTFLTQFQLNDFNIVELKLNNNYIIIQNDNNEIFIINNNIGSKLEVLHQVYCKYDILQFIIADIVKDIEIYILIREKDESYADKLFIVSVKDSVIKKLLYKLPQLYLNIQYLAEQTLLAVPYNKNEIDILTCKRTVTVSSVIKTPHQLAILNVLVMNKYFLTWGFDGIVCIFNIKKEILEKIILTSNRRSYVDITKKVLFTPKHCLILSRNSVLKCYNLSLPNIMPENLELNIERYFKTATISPNNNLDISWEASQLKEQIKAEKLEFAEHKSQLLKKLISLQQKLSILIDENENLEDDDDRLPISSFDLGREWTAMFSAKAKKHREAEEKILRGYIEDQNRIQMWIIKHTCQEMIFNSSRIYGIFSAVMCENFSLIAQNLSYTREQLIQISLFREKEKALVGTKIWYPWFSMLATQHYINDVYMVMLGTQSIHSIQSDAENIQGDKFKSERRYALSGSGTHNFIEPHPSRYQQLEVVSYNQLFIENSLAKMDIRDLKIFFNKEFEEMKKFKNDQVAYVKNRNARLREIQTQMNKLAKLKKSDILHDRVISDPNFLPEERPETILKVEDNEVSVRPYISPSKQKMLDEIAYQAELRRLALLADDFRERALIAMMDGVLEKRWEDEIMKDVPIPEILLKNKDPGEYTKEDFKIIKDYEDKVQFILSERERYQGMLEEEDIKIKELQREQIMRFNRKCGELFIRKIWIDAAIKHEEIKLMRMSEYNMERISLKLSEDKIREALVAKKLEISSFNKQMEMIEKKVIDSRLKYEQMSNRDRQLDKNFKAQFSDNAPSYIVDQGYKYFKKRPKLPDRAWATAAVLTDMSNRVINRYTATKKFPLPPECYDFLNLLDNIDNFTSAPNTFDQKMWTLLCQLRRQKVESELRLKALGIQLAEAEVSANNYNKELAAKRAQLFAIEKELNNMGQKNSNLAKNRSVQLVMPMGIVETNLTGHLSDFEGCMLLSLVDVEGINDIIKEAGYKKVKSMQQVAIFRRKVIYKQWEHKVAQMSVQDLKGIIAIVNSTTLTIEMRQCLKQKNSGKQTELTNATLNRDRDKKKKYIEGVLRRIEMKIEEVKTQINNQKIENKKLDRTILNINVDVTEQNLLRDYALEEREVLQEKERMQNIVERSKLVRQIQSGHSQILELITLLELQRLKTFPTLTSTKPDTCS